MNAALASPQQRDRYAGFGAYHQRPSICCKAPPLARAFDIDQETTETATGMAAIRWDRTC